MTAGTAVRLTSKKWTNDDLRAVDVPSLAVNLTAHMNSTQNKQHDI